MNHAMAQKLIQIGNEKVTDWRSVKNKNITSRRLK